MVESRERPVLEALAGRAAIGDKRVGSGRWHDGVREALRDQQRCRDWVIRIFWGVGRERCIESSLKSDFLSVKTGIASLTALMFYMDPVTLKRKLCYTPE